MRGPPSRVNDQGLLVLRWGREATVMESPDFVNSNEEVEDHLHSR